jgi:organic radical activating enzyme
VQQIPYKGEVRISWFVTAWCNYSCHYCFTLVFHKRAADGAKQYHAFDHYPAEAWIGALRSLPYSRINLNCTGGEVMLDRKNMLSALTGLTADPRFEISITTNGTFDPAYFGSLDKRNIYLTLSFHPSETSLDQFARRAATMRDAGFKVAMINMVIDPRNIDVFERAIGELEADGFFVNVGTMLPAGEYWSRLHTQREERELDLLERYNTPLDVYYKVAEPPTKGRLCYYPARSFSLMPDGRMGIYCTDISRNLFTEGPPELTRRSPVSMTVASAATTCSARSPTSRWCVIRLSCTTTAPMPAK